MTRTTGEIFDFGFEGFQYKLAIITHNGIPSAVFVAQNETDGCWHSMDIPNVLKKFPELLELFVQALAEEGFTLLAVPSEEITQG